MSLHKWFPKEEPPGDRIIIDQPSQAHYPPDQDADGSIDVLSNEDKTAVEQLFGLIKLAARELAPDLQIIILDHADLKTPWFQDAIVERWRGRKLIPENWMTEA